MRVLWLSPWMRPLARVYVDALAAAGHEALLVTSDQHHEAVKARDDERVLDPRPRDPRTLGPLLRTVREARMFRPDVVVAELVWDPRWLALARLAPLVYLVHDDTPHDETETRPAWQRALFDHLCRHARRVVTFSSHVADRMTPRLRRRPDVVPLTSDVAESDVPSPRPQRRDFVLFGRMGMYKNVPVALRAWQAHHDSTSYRGDRLLLIGDGPLGLDMLPPACEWRRARYQYSDVLDVLAGAKGSMVHYRVATQSGVQLLSLQLGVTPMVSDSGGLAEFQPPDEAPIGMDDVAGLAAAFSALADPAEAARRGARARAHYAAHYAAPRSAGQLLEVLTEAGG